MITLQALFFVIYDVKLNFSRYRDIGQKQTLFSKRVCRCLNRFYSVVPNTVGVDDRRERQLRKYVSLAFGNKRDE